MPVTLKHLKMNVKDPTTGNYESVDILSDGTTAERIAAINSAGTTQVSNVNSAGSNKVAAVNSAGATQVANVNSAGTTQVAAVQAKGEEVLESIPEDYSSLVEDVGELNSAFNELPTEETGQELLDKETGNAGLTETALAVIGLLFDRMPQNETATDIYYSLLLENERLLAIYEIWEAERSA